MTSPAKLANQVKIYIVEDDPLMIRMYEKIFHLNGYEVEVALDGAEGMKRLRVMSDKPTVIMLDVMTPNKSGFDVLKEIKADPDMRSIPVIMITNLAGSDDAERALDMGAAMYLIKSQYDPQEVVDKVKGVIDSVI